jgi:PKD repeat protein
MFICAKVFLGLMILCLWLTPAAYANCAPFAAISINQTEALQRATLLFSSEGSVDPDELPKQLSFRWDFGDGWNLTTCWSSVLLTFTNKAFSTEASPRHAFVNLGAYEVFLTVSDGADRSVASSSGVILDSPASHDPPRTKLIDSDLPVFLK